MALAVVPILAQEGEPPVKEEEQQIEEAINEATRGEEEAAQEPEPEPEVAPEPEPEPEPAVVQEPEPEPAVVQEPEPEPVAETVAETEPEQRQKQSHPQYREVQTLMKGSGGFGALSIGYTEVNNRPALLMGARAEWVLGHGFGIGFGAVGFASDPEIVGEYSIGIAGGYGGLVLEPIIVGWFPIHVAFPVLIGGGGLSSYATWNNYPIGDEPVFSEYAAFFVLEAGAELEFNLVRSVVLSLFANYRWTPTLTMQGFEGTSFNPMDYPIATDALNSWSFGIRFKFGSF